METKKQSQVAELVRRNFSIVLQEEGGYIYGNEALVTVTQVKMTPDMAIAKIYLSVFNIEDKQSPVIAMQAELTRLRHALSKRIKSMVRRIPNLQFYLDDTIDEMYRVDQMIHRLKEDKQMGEDEETEDRRQKTEE